MNCNIPSLDHDCIGGAVTTCIGLSEFDLTVQKQYLEVSEALDRAAACFYVGSVILVLEVLHDRSHGGFVVCPCFCPDLGDVI